MDWRKKTRQKLQSPSVAEKLLTWLDCFPNGDQQLIDVISNGGIISFPHTELDYSGEMTMRVVTSLYSWGAQRVIALGVIHQGTLPEPYKDKFATLLDPQAPAKMRQENLKIFQGGFVRSHELTAFGNIPTVSPQTAWRRIRKDNQLLRGEFCLEYFLSFLHFAADHLHTDVPPVFPVYIGATFDPATGSFRIAREVADEILQWHDDKTAVVITGDLVHYGTTYSTSADMEGKPTAINELERHFLPLIERAFHLAFQQKNYPEAFRYFNEILHNDQRLLFPVVSEMLGPQPTYHIIEFHLSDYAPIWKVTPPSVVASSLVALCPKTHTAQTHT